MCHVGVHLTLGELGKPGLEPYISTCWRSPKSFYDRWRMSGHLLSHGLLGSCPTQADWVPPPIDLDIKLLLYCLPQNLNQSICKHVILLMIGKVGGQKHITYYIVLFSRPIFTTQHQKFLSWLFLCSTCSSVWQACLSSSAHLFTPSPPTLSFSLGNSTFFPYLMPSNLPGLWGHQLEYSQRLWTCFLSRKGS